MREKNDAVARVDGSDGLTAVANGVRSICDDSKGDGELKDYEEEI